MVSEEYSIKGMHCNSCAMLIEMTLREKRGIESVIVDKERKMATLLYDEHLISFDEIEASIKPLGYFLIK